VLAMVVVILVLPMSECKGNFGVDGKLGCPYNPSKEFHLANYTSL
jgi:hypothetical protein